MLEQRKEFNPIILPQRKLAIPGGEGVAYRVYKDATEFSTVNAETVADAIEKSGIPVPFKVVRVSMSAQNILDSSLLEAPQNTAPAASQETPVNQEKVANPAEKA